MATFGKTTIGTTANVAWPGSSSSISLCQFNLADNNASISKLTSYSSTLSAATEMKLLIYDDVGNKPNSVIAVTLPASILANQFIDSAFQSPFTLNSGNYWLGIIANEQGFGVASAAGTNYVAGGNAYPTITSPFPGGASSITSSFQKSIYATYTINASGDGWIVALV